MSINFASEIDLKQSGTSRLSGSQIVQPYTPSFSAYGTTGIFGINVYIVFPTEIFDIGGGYNPANGLYTAPVGGIYYFTGYFLMESAPTGENRHLMLKNGAVYAGSYFIIYKDIAGYWTARCSSHMQMAAGDTAGVYRTQGVNTHNNGAFYAFGGHLVA
jgi:hypothetical protein